MTKREEYDALAAELKAAWDVATKATMSDSQWDEVTAAAKASEDQLRAIPVTRTSARVRGREV